MADIDVAFQTRYENDVLHALQQDKTMLRPTVRFKNSKGAKEVEFRKYGKMEMQERTSHRSEIPLSNGDTSVVKCGVKDYTTRSLVDKFDALKTEMDEYDAAVKAGASACARKLDSILLTELGTQATTIVHNSTGWTKAKALILRKTVSSRFIPFDMDLVCVVGPNGWNSLMDIDQFSKAEYLGFNNEKDLPWPSGLQAKRWMGINWLEHPAIATVSTIEKSFCYHKSGIGLAMPEEIGVDPGWLRSHQSWEIVYTLSGGAKIIDSERLIVTENYYA